MESEGFPRATDVLAMASRADSDTSSSCTSSLGEEMKCQVLAAWLGLNWELIVSERWMVQTAFFALSDKKSTLTEKDLFSRANPHPPSSSFHPPLLSPEAALWPAVAMKAENKKTTQKMGQQDH